MAIVTGVVVAGATAVVDQKPEPLVALTWTPAAARAVVVELDGLAAGLAGVGVLRMTPA